MDDKMDKLLAAYCTQFPGCGIVIIKATKVGLETDLRISTNIDGNDGVLNVMEGAVKNMKGIIEPFG